MDKYRTRNIQRGTVELECFETQVEILEPMDDTDTYKYVGCTKSIGPLVGKNTIIYFDVWNPNPLQSSLLGNAHISSSGPAFAGNISGKLLMESRTAGLSRSA